MEDFDISTESNDTKDFDTSCEKANSEAIENKVNTDVTNSSVQLYLNAINETPILTEEEEKELGHRIKYGETEEIRTAAKNELVNRNLRYVVTVAKRYAVTTTSMDILDLIQEGNLGLMIAANKFDVDLGFRFTTYATHWIIQSVTRAIKAKDTSIRYPVHVNDLYLVISREQMKRKMQGLPEMTDDEIMNNYSITKESLALTKEIPRNHRMTELDKPAKNNEDQDTTIGDILLSDKRTPEDEIMHNDMKTQIQKALGLLNERERYVITHRFGLNNESEDTLSTIGDRLGVTRERVRQIENTALRKLRTPGKMNRNLRFYAYA